MDPELVSTKQFFALHHITLSDEWLESCIEWYRDENPNSNYTSETLHQKVYEQWLLLDLRVTEVSILPLNLNNKQKMVLNGVFSLQLMYVIDISQPKLSQLQKIRKTVHNATDEEYNTNINAKRMLQLVLTDGVQEVEAIEYKPIPFLDLNLTPGVKMKINGPITIRRGQLMLESKNVVILGGEVEELLVSNAAENILAKELNLPLNPQPNKLETPATNPFTQTSNATYNNTNTRNRVVNNSRETNGVGNTLFQSSITSYTTNASNSNNEINQEEGNMSRQNSRVSTSRNNQNIQNDNIKSFETIHKLDGKNNVKPFIEDEEQMIIECDELLELEKDFEMEKRKNQELTNTSVQCSSNRINRFADETDVDVFDEIDIDRHLDLIDQQVAKKVMSIDELLSINKANDKFNIKAKFKSVSSKLTISNVQQWSLRIIVEDCTGEIESWVHTDVISKAINFTPAAGLGLREDIRNKNQVASNLMMQKINDLRSKIEALDCVMEITFKSSDQYPTITCLK